jgi:hypothetical protein
MYTHMKNIIPPLWRATVWFLHAPGAAGGGWPAWLTTTGGRRWRFSAARAP